ncbi:hypothetical protein [Archaeoglobus veneficus]|nr:hypothetical protein [Archaeoglobus veneficus]
MILIEPLTKFFVDGHVVKGEKVKQKVFGGFCTCGGVMYQKSWFREGNFYILVSECEKCWRNEAMAFNGSKNLISRDEVRVIDRTEMKKFLKELLSTSEYDALIARARDEEYNYNAFSRAKKKLEDIGLEVEEVMSYL